MPLLDIQCRREFLLEDNARTIRGIVQRHLQALHVARRARAERREARQGEDRRGCVGGRLVAHPESAEDAAGLDERQGALQEHQPGRSGRVRGRRAGRSPHGRAGRGHPGPPFGGRDAPLVGHRDRRRCKDLPGQAQHTHPI